MNKQAFILGAGLTGLAAGISSGFPIYEAAKIPGGICASYYMHSYRFEIGGGHWIWGGDPAISRFIRSLTPVRMYSRKTMVYFVDWDLSVPYPVQYNLRYFSPSIRYQILREMTESVSTQRSTATMFEWLHASFGLTLCRLFFDPFHELYTSGLWKSVVSQDSFKSPVNLSQAIRGAFEEIPLSGYNTSFVYPIDGLGKIAQSMADKCNIDYEKQIVKIDTDKKILHFSDGKTVHYDFLLSTLPLNRMMEMTNLSVGEKPDPSTSVLVINIGALRGPKCPREHWVYIPRSKAGFHRVGFYSNVDSSFLPSSARSRDNHVSIYVEKSYADKKPSEIEINVLCKEVVNELQEWKWIENVEAIDPTWIDVAYTWSWPFSKWRDRAIKTLEENSIWQVGRFARWISQGIADSMRDGFLAGVTMKNL
jgi:protoporphyrinogen oxidase